jgi:hypothetical protein
MARDELFAGLCLLACANGLGGRVIQSINRLGWTGALLDSFDTSAIAWFSCFAGLLFILREKREPIQSTDVAVAAGSLILIALPIGGMSWLAVTGLGLYMGLLTDAPLSRRRGAVILLATTVPMLWTGLAFRFFNNPILEIDASLVAWVLGTARLGTMVSFADASGYMTIWQPCSSFLNVPYAFLTWVVACQVAGRRWSSRDLWWCAAVCAAVIGVNVVRLSVMGLNLGYYTAIHNQWGDTFVNLIALSLAVGISTVGVRHELFSRA